jgi:hypothetical protein
LCASKVFHIIGAGSSPVSGVLHREAGARGGGLHLLAHRRDLLGRAAVDRGEVLVLALASGGKSGFSSNGIQRTSMSSSFSSS